MTRPTRHLLLGALAAATLTASCGDGTPEQNEPQASGSEFSLVVTRGDGSTLEFDDYTLTCRPRFYDGLSPRGEILEVRSQPDPTRKNFIPYFFIHAVVADVKDGATFELGSESGFVYDDPSGVDMALTDGRADEPFVIDDERSHGALTVRSASCSPEPAIELEVSGTLANEETALSVDVVGSIDVSG